MEGAGAHDEQNSMQHPDQRESELACTHQDATLAEQILDDSPHPDAREYLKRARRAHPQEFGDRSRS
ncbi:MAG TPA: hypothetical protein VFV33_05120 [Gemmatimonadaceae bacterium]|nr:hypothetical protein [Gemmatimonadaceae bacterium]